MKWHSNDPVSRAAAVIATALTAAAIGSGRKHDTDTYPEQPDVPGS